MDKQYLIIWSMTGVPVTGTIVTLVHPPREESKGSILQDFAVEALAEHLNLNPDRVHVYSIEELANHVWCNGQTRECVIGGRAACLEACHGGWVLHI